MPVVVVVVVVVVVRAWTGRPPALPGRRKVG